MKMICMLFAAAVVVACDGGKADANVVTDDAECVEYDDVNEPYACTSEDGVVTIESGTCPGGGSAPDYFSRWLFENEDGDFCQVSVVEDSYVSEVHSIKKDDGSTYYITMCFSKDNSVDGSKWVEAHRIVGDTIVRVSVIDGGKNTGNDAFAVDYCIPEWYFATNGEGYGWLFEYDPETRNLYVPCGEERKLTDRYHLWHFNGKRFVDMGEKPHKDLHPSLADYNQLVKYFETKDYIVRVDSLDSHELRYATWRKPKTMKDKPDVVVRKK